MSKLAGNPDELEPPWAKHPEILCGSIGWRMGYGEGYTVEWGERIDERCPDVDAAVRYLKGHPPAPRSWTSWIASWFEDLGGDEDQIAALIQREGLVGDDASYPVFVRNCMREGGMVGPWESDRDPETAFRYDIRRLGWWARWFAGEPEADRRDWLAHRVAAPDSWAPIVAQITAGTYDATWPSLEGGPDRLIPLLAARGELPGPWIGGHRPRPDIVIWEIDRADDRDRWCWWVSETFEDPTTWNAYLARHAAPPEWAALMAEDLGF